MRIGILTNEYPPYIYGGAGVHVEYLTRELACIENGRHSVSIFCFGDQDIRQGNLTARGINPEFNLPYLDPKHKKFMETMLRDLVMAGMMGDVDVVHCHTWYTHLAGCMVQRLTGARLVLTTHSLEPHRPWKFEQLGMPTTRVPGSRRPPTRTPTASSPSPRRCGRTCTRSTASPTRRSGLSTTGST